MCLRRNHYWCWLCYGSTLIPNGNLVGDGNSLFDDICGVTRCVHRDNFTVRSGRIVVSTFVVGWGETRNLFVRIWYSWCSQICFMFSNSFLISASIAICCCSITLFLPMMLRFSSCCCKCLIERSDICSSSFSIEGRVEGRSSVFIASRARAWFVRASDLQFSYCCSWLVVLSSCFCNFSFLRANSLLFVDGLPDVDWQSAIKLFRRFGILGRHSIQKKPTERTRLIQMWLDVNCQMALKLVWCIPCELASPTRYTFSVLWFTKQSNFSIPYKEKATVAESEIANWERNTISLACLNAQTELIMRRICYSFSSSIQIPFDLILIHLNLINDNQIDSWRESSISADDIFGLVYVINQLNSQN